MLRDVKEVKPRGCYRLWLRFDNDVEGEVDLEPMLSFDGVFAPLRDENYFAQVRVDPELATLMWPNGADFAPEFLRQRVRVAA